MNDISNIMGNVTTLLALVGGGLSAVALAYAGIMWMTASGDPQKMAQVRTAVIGVVGGLILVGLAFIIPRVVSQVVVEPAGGVTFDWDVGFNCDQVLRDQLAVQRSVSDTARVNILIGQIQSQREECSSEIWNPKATNIDHHSGDGCFSAQVLAGLPVGLTEASRLKVGSSVVPRTFRVKEGILYSIRSTSGRMRTTTSSSTGTPGGPPPLPTRIPSDGSKCWLYVSQDRGLVRELLSGARKLSKR